MDDGKNKLKILLAEDNAINQELVMVYLKMSGYSCDTADNGKIALEMLKADSYDVLLLDIQMPILDGEQVLKEVRADEDLKDLTVIALTANILHGEENHFLEMGFDEIVAKPIQRRELEEKLDSIVNTRR
jgi:CheY-like chemotaxis protein